MYIKIIIYVLYFRSCPECRVSSDFVCPSAFWVETKEEKDKLLNDYRKALGIKDCKYFKKVYIYINVNYYIKIHFNLIYLLL